MWTYTFDKEFVLLYKGYNLHSVLGRQEINIKVSRKSIQSLFYPSLNEKNKNCVIGGNIE